MAPLRSAFLHELEWRGFVHQCTDLDALDALAADNRLTAYVGFDCTADSLHIGNLISIMMLRILQRSGHHPIALVGGGTTKVGDPSGKNESRQLLTQSQIDDNKAGIRRSLAKFLGFGEAGALLADNAEWLDRLEYIPFLRDFGSHFTINRMLTFDSVRLRLEREQPLTLLEFNYMVMQAFDFLELSRRFECRLQMGGSDQWGNIVNGVELGRRIDAVQLFGLTSPLMTTASGQKMGKTAAGAVWLNGERLPAFDYWQFWRNAEDADVVRFLRLFTDLGSEEIERLGKLQGGEINEAKKVLATEATALCHGRTEAEAAAAAARGVFEGAGAVEGLSVRLVPGSASGVSANVAVYQAGLAASLSDARRQIRAGSVRFNDQLITDETALIRAESGNDRLSLGKKRHVIIRDPEAQS